MSSESLTPFCRVVRCGLRAHVNYEKCYVYGKNYPIMKEQNENIKTKSNKSGEIESWSQG